MAAKNNINPDQLKMLMTPKEIDPVGSIDNPDSLDPLSSVEERKEALEETLLAKEKGADVSGLYDSVMDEGVKAPVQIIHDPLGGNIIGHGNHRFAVSMNKPDTLIPVIHTQGVRSDGDLWKFDEANKFHSRIASHDYKDYMSKIGLRGVGSEDSWAWWR